MSKEAGDHQHHPTTMNFGMVAMMLCSLALIAVLFFFQPGASGYGLLLFLLLMACPLMHLFMHRGHSGYYVFGGHEDVLRLSLFWMHLVWWAFWVILIFTLFGWFEPVPKKRVRRDAPIEILKRRFASGEITEEEYLAKKSLIDDETPKPVA